MPHKTDNILTKEMKPLMLMKRYHLNYYL